MTDASRTQGWAICGGAAFLSFLFLIGILSGSYWALALPVAVLVFFVLGLAAWVGYTIATIQVEAEPEATPPAGDSRDSSDSDGSASSPSA